MSKCAAMKPALSGGLTGRQMRAFADHGYTRQEAGLLTYTTLRVLVHGLSDYT